MAGATVVADGGFSATTDADGRFQLVDSSGNSCAPEGPLRLTVTEPRRRTAVQIITVPSKGSTDTTVLIACRRITGRVVDDAGLGPNPSSVALFGLQAVLSELGPSLDVDLVGPLRGIASPLIWYRDDAHVAAS